MNLEFKVKRFFLLFRKDLFSIYKTGLLVFLTISLVIFAISITSAWIKYNDKNLHKYMFFSILFLGGLIFTSRMFIEMHSLKTVQEWILLPASILEKMISRLLIGTVVWTICIILWYFAISLLSELVNTGLFARGHCLFNPFSREIWEIIPHYFVIHSVFFLGAVYFRKIHFVKTVLIITLAGLVFLAVFLILVRLFFWDVLMLNNSAYRLESMTNIGLIQLKQLDPFVPFTVEVAKTLYWVVPIPFFWVISYLRLREQEACNAV